MPEFILVVGLLTTESSYEAEVERAAGTVVDTAQFWFSARAPWRIRTYAIDHDIHVYALGTRADGSAFRVDEAEAHIHKHYAEILGSLKVLKFRDPSDSSEVFKVLASHGLTGTLEVAPAGFAFYNPDRGTYKTRSQPK